MAKVEYVTTAIKSGTLVSWYPHWYCGTTVTQYYPPLSIYLLAVIHLVMRNVMLTFKVFNTLMLTIGGVGMWLLCRKYIGKWVGLLGSLFYIIQPFILITLLGQGQVAQGPIIALNPWYLIAVISLIKNPSRRGFVICTCLCSIMILSHPNSIFMNAVCIVGALVVLLALGRLHLLAFVLFGLSILFSGALTAFWSLVGVTGLENATIPHVLGEAVQAFSATAEWFLDRNHFFYFSIAGQLATVLAAGVHLYRHRLKIAQYTDHAVFIFLLILFILSYLFSFGLALPLFQYIPMAQSMVAGRILSLTSISAAFFCAYSIDFIVGTYSRNRLAVHIFRVILAGVFIFGIVVDMDPLRVEYSFREVDFWERVLGADAGSGCFDKGRFTFLGPYDCSSTYFPAQFGYNLSEGYNIEGTPHNRDIWSETIAVYSKNTEYVKKNYAFWNVRYLTVLGKFSELLDSRDEFDYFAWSTPADLVNESDMRIKEFFVSERESSYTLVDNRNSLIIGPGSYGPALDFPFLIHEQERNLADFTVSELCEYKVIYLSEPQVRSKKEKVKLEKLISDLTKEGVQIIIEPVPYQSVNLFGVTATGYPHEGDLTLFIQPASPIASTTTVSSIDIDINIGSILVLHGLDDVYFQLGPKGEDKLKNDVIGAKRIDGGSVLFLGMHLSQYLKGAYARYWGFYDDQYLASSFPQNIETLFLEFFDHFGVEKNFWPDAFPSGQISWDDTGLSFAYDSDRDEEVTVSLTYSPRWKAFLDREEISVRQKEHLVVLQLPAGSHAVELVYGVTKYGITGYAISVISLLLFFQFFLFYDKMSHWIGKVIARIKNMLQIA